MSKLTVRDKDGKILQTVEGGKITTYDADKHLSELSAFFGLDKAVKP